jgi:hypothetical protein
MTLLPPDNQPTKINLAPELGLDNLGDEVCAEYQAVADRVYGAATGQSPKRELLKEILPREISKLESICERLPLWVPHPRNDIARQSHRPRITRHPDLHRPRQRHPPRRIGGAHGRHRDWAENNHPPQAAELRPDPYQNRQGSVAPEGSRVRACDHSKLKDLSNPASRLGADRYGHQQA